MSEKQRHCWNLFCSGRLRKWAFVGGSDNFFVTNSEGLEAKAFPSSGNIFLAISEGLETQLFPSSLLSRLSIKMVSVVAQKLKEKRNHEGKDKINSAHIHVR